MTSTGRILRRLTNNPKFDAAPVWSPDGRRIAFYSQRTPNGDVFVVNADGTGLKNLTRNQAHDGPGSWSSDGKSIVFDSDRASGTGIYVMRANGSGVRRLTTGGTDSDPAWSPDGSTIAFTSNRDGNDEIYVMKTDGSGQTNITNSPGADVTAGVVAERAVARLHERSQRSRGGVRDGRAGWKRAQSRDRRRAQLVV